MVYQTSGEIYYLCLILLKRPVLNDEDSCTLTAVRGSGKPIVFLSYQQSAVAHGYVKSTVDAQLTFDNMCRTGTAAQCRSRFVILTLHGYATHGIFEIPEKKRFFVSRLYYFSTSNGRGCTTDDVVRSGKVFPQESFFFENCWFSCTR
jgi:hypothetical protein